MAIQPYMFFNGRCEEAIKYYEKALGAKVLMLMRFKDNPDKPPPQVVSPDLDEKIMHASIEIAGSELMMSDGMGGGEQAFKGISLSLGVPKASDVDRYFNALVADGTTEMPLSKTFFAERFGCVRDKFGVSWMIIAAPTVDAPKPS